MVPAVTTLHRHLFIHKSSSWGTPAVKRSNRLVILVGVLLAVLAFVGIVVVLNQNAGQEQQGPLLETVLVATQDVAIGDPVTPDMVEPRQVEADAVIGTPLRDASQVQGQPALFAIPAGTQVTQAALGLGLGVQNIAGQLSDGERAIALVMDRVQAVDFLLQPGDTVDIVTSVHLRPPAESGEVRSVKVLLQNKRVLYVSDSRIEAAAAAAEATPGPDGQAPPAPAPVTTVVIIIAGTDQDAEIIRFAQRSAGDAGEGGASSLSLTLRPGGDETVQTTTGITIEQLIEDYGLLIPDLTEIEDLTPDEAPAQ